MSHIKRTVSGFYEASLTLCDKFFLFFFGKIVHSIWMYCTHTFMKGTQSTKYFILFFRVSDAFIFRVICESWLYDIFISHIIHTDIRPNVWKKKGFYFFYTFLVRNSIKGDKDDNHLKFSFCWEASIIFCVFGYLLVLE